MKPKFRIYDKKHNTFQYKKRDPVPQHDEDGNYVGWYEEKGSEIDIFFSTLDSILSDDQFVIQQATPFCDRNGQQIYEGDLVSFQATSEEFALQGIAVHIFEVFIDEKTGSFYLRNVDNKQTEYAGDWLSTTNSDCEIVGNVFDE